MRLAGEIGGFADEMILSVQDLGYLGGILETYIGKAVRCGLEADAVTDSHRIGGFIVPESDFSFQDSRKWRPIRQTGQQIMTASILDNCRFADHKWRIRESNS